MASAEYGLFGILIAVHSWIFLLGDSLALQNIIQFGTHVEQRGQGQPCRAVLSIFDYTRSVAADFLLQRLHCIRTEQYRLAYNRRKPAPCLLC